MNLETQKVQNHVKMAHEGSVKYCAIDAQGEYIATTGTEGMLHIGNVKDLDSQVTNTVKKIKVTKKSNVPVEST
jgi:hypothetical protein